MRTILFTVIIGLLVSAAAASAAEIDFHGQFRINYFSEDQSGNGATDTDTSAARLRWRPTWDVTLPDDVRMHMQLNIGHIDSNSSNARYDQSGKDPAVAVRHAVLDFKLPEIGGRINAGLAPVSDKFGDTLFSGDWDFNPLALLWLGKIAAFDVRLGAGKLAEGTSAANTEKDIYVGDIDIPTGAGSVGFSGYLYREAPGSIVALVQKQAYLGVRTTQPLGPAQLSAFIVYNSGAMEKAVGGQDMNNKGYAAKLEGTMPIGPVKAGLLFITASGDKNYGANTSVKSFITPMGLIDHQGYWGYTGKLNIQGPTDTGIDNPVRIDGSTYGGAGQGFGIMTLQAKAVFPVAGKLSGYFAAGIFKHDDVPAGMKDMIGTDFYLEAAYALAQNLNLQAGVDVASLKKNNPAYGFANDNTTTLFATRLQLEY